MRSLRLLRVRVCLQVLPLPHTVQNYFHLLEGSPGTNLARQFGIARLAVAVGIANVCRAVLTEFPATRFTGLTDPTGEWRIGGPMMSWPLTRQPTNLLNSS